MAAAKKPRKAKAAAPAASNDLLIALEWVKVAQKPNSAFPNETHCRIGDGWVTAFDGTIAAGHRINLDLNAAPRTDRLLAALAKAGEGLSITFDGQLTIASDKLRVTVPCLPVDTLPRQWPSGHDGVDALEGGTLDDLLVGMAAVGVIAKEGADCVLESSVLLDTGSVTGCDRKIVLQYWHGLTFPTMVVPKAFVSAVCKHKGLTHVAWSEGTVTFWFGEDKWLRTQLYQDKWPGIAQILDVDCSPVAVPTGLIEAVEAVAPHAESGNVMLGPATGVSTTDNRRCVCR
jgi:hypothetical protein